MFELFINTKYLCTYLKTYSTNLSKQQDYHMNSTIRRKAKYLMSDLNVLSLSVEISHLYLAFSLAEGSIFCS